MVLKVLVTMREMLGGLERGWEGRGRWKTGRRSEEVVCREGREDAGSSRLFRLL